MALNKVEICGVKYSEAADFECRKKRMLCGNGLWRVTPTHGSSISREISAWS